MQITYSIWVVNVTQLLICTIYDLLFCSVNILCDTYSICATIDAALLFVWDISSKMLQYISIISASQAARVFLKLWYGTRC